MLNFPFSSLSVCVVFVNLWVLIIIRGGGKDQFSKYHNILRGIIVSIHGRQFFFFSLYTLFILQKQIQLLATY